MTEAAHAILSLLAELSSCALSLSPLLPPDMSAIGVYLGFPRSCLFLLRNRFIVVWHASIIYNSRQLQTSNNYIRGFVRSLRHFQVTITGI